MKVSSAVQASQVVLAVKNPPANAGDLTDVGLIPGLEDPLCAFTHRVAFEEGSGPRVLLKSGPGNRGHSACGTTHVAHLEFLRETGLMLRCAGKAGNPFQTMRGNRLSCRDQEGRSAPPCHTHRDLTSLAVQWLRLCASTEGGMGLIPSWGTKILHVMWLERHPQLSLATRGYR